MDISFIRPPAYSVGIMGAQQVPFLGIAYIAAAAKQAGHNVDVIDMCGEDIDRSEIVHDKFVSHGMPFPGLKQRLKYNNIIGFSFSFSQDWVFNRELVQHVRALSPGSLLIAGGEQISSIPHYCLEDCPELDICVIGEGEEILGQLLGAVESGESWSTVKGLVYRDRKENEIKETPRAKRIEDIDSLPLPAWELIPLENYLSRQYNYHIERGRTIPMLASRGCPYKCTFCSNTNMWGSSRKIRNPKLVVDEMESCIKKYNVNNFVFSDLTAVVKKQEIVDLCNEITNRKLDITIQLPTLRTEGLDFDVLKLMYDAGCREVDFAIESGALNVLKSIKKGNNPGNITSLIRRGLNTKINFSINIVLGLPEEEFNDFLKTYLLTMKLALIGLQEVNAFPFIPYPGSELFYQFKEEKKLLLSDKFFLDLYGYADLSKAISWSNKFSPGTLRFLRFFLLFSFYSLMLLSHPKRIIKLIENFVRGKSTTKLEGVLKRILKSLSVHFYTKRKYAKKDI